MMVCVSANALSRSSSLGRIVASFRLGCFSARRFLMNAIHSFWFAALSAPVMIANSPVPSEQARGLVGERVGNALPASPG